MQEEYPVGCKPLTTAISFADKKLLPKDVSRLIDFDKQLSAKVLQRKLNILTSARVGPVKDAPNAIGGGHNTSKKNGLGNIGAGLLSSSRHQPAKLENHAEKNQNRLDLTIKEISSTGFGQINDQSFRHQPKNVLDISISEVGVVPHQGSTPKGGYFQIKTQDAYNIPRKSPNRYARRRGYGLQTNGNLSGTISNTFGNTTFASGNKLTAVGSTRLSTSTDGPSTDPVLGVGGGLHSQTFAQLHRELMLESGDGYGEVGSHRAKRVETSFGSGGGGWTGAYALSNQYQVNDVSCALDMGEETENDINQQVKDGPVRRFIPDSLKRKPVKDKRLINTEESADLFSQLEMLPNLQQRLNGPKIGNPILLGTLSERKGMEYDHVIESRYQLDSGEKKSTPIQSKASLNNMRYMSGSSLPILDRKAVNKQKKERNCFCAHPLYGLSTVCDGHVDCEYFKLLKKGVAQVKDITENGKIADIPKPDSARKRSSLIFNLPRASPRQTFTLDSRSPPYRSDRLPLTLTATNLPFSDFYRRNTAVDITKTEQDIRRKKLRELFARAWDNNGVGWQKGRRLQQVFQEGLRMLVDGDDVTVNKASQNSVSSSVGKGSSPNSPIKLGARMKMEEMRLKMLLQDELDAKEREKKKEKWAEAERLRQLQKQREYERLQRGIQKKQEYLDKKKLLDTSNMNSSRNEDIELPTDGQDLDQDKVNQMEDSKYQSHDDKSSHTPTKVVTDFTQLVPSSMLDPRFLFLSPEKSDFLTKSMRGIGSRRGSFFYKSSKSKMGSQLELLDPSSFRGGSQRRQSRFEVLADRIDDGDPDFSDPLHLHTHCLDYDEAKVGFANRLPAFRKSSADETQMVYRSPWMNIINKLLGFFDLKRVDKIGYFERLELEPQIEIEHSDYNDLPSRMQLAYEQEFLMLGYLIEDLNVDEDMLGIHILRMPEIRVNPAMEDYEGPTVTPFSSPAIGLSIPPDQPDLDADSPYEMDWDSTDISYMQRLYAPNRIIYPDE